MGNVVSSQESRHEVGDGASLSTVRPEQERAQASFPTGKLRSSLVHPAQDPTGLGPALPAQGRQSPTAGSAQLTQGILETTLPKMQRSRPRAPLSQQTPSLGNREGA